MAKITQPGQRWYHDDGKLLGAVIVAILVVTICGTVLFRNYLNSAEQQAQRISESLHCEWSPTNGICVCASPHSSAWALGPDRLCNMDLDGAPQWR